MWPAVSIRGVPSIESKYDSRRSSTSPESNFVPAMSNVDFNRLFTSSASPPPDLQFFTDGLASTEHDNAQDDPDDFSFDQMVDLDACQSHADVFNEPDDITDNDDVIRPSINFFASLPGASADISHQTAATSSALQPCLGASS